MELNPHTPGAKLDQGKIKPRLIVQGFARALEEVSRVATYGAEKYTDGGWEHVPDGINRYTDAMLRHFFAESSTGPVDEESGLFHSAQVAWNALARLELILREGK